MKGFKLFSTKLWDKILCPIWSAIVNSFYWLFRFWKIPSALSKKKEYLNIPSIQELMSKFKWREDNYKDWIPWIITIIDKDLEDDCDGAAALARWWWREHCVDARLVFLYSDDGGRGHAICVTKDNSKYVSNNIVGDLDPTDWRQDLIKKFNNVYSIVIEE